MAGHVAVTMAIYVWIDPINLFNLFLSQAFISDRFWLGEGLFTPMVCCTTGRSSYSSQFYFRIIVWDAIIYEIVPKQCNGCNWIHLKYSSPMCLQTFSQSRNNHQLKAGGQALSAPKQYLKAQELFSHSASLIIRRQLCHRNVSPSISVFRVIKFWATTQLLRWMFICQFVLF